MLHLDVSDYAAMVADPLVGERIAGHDGVRLVVVHGDAADIADPGSLPLVVGWLGDELGGVGPRRADLVVSADVGLDHLTALVGSRPRAAVSLALLLRQSEQLDVEAGLAAESAVYSMLQGGAELAQWRGATEPAAFDQDESTVLVDRHGDELRITLNRPARHNAVTRQLRDDLCAALAIARFDASITSVVIDGRGPSFCSGGDLAEFGLRPDPVTGHVARLAQSPARLIHRLADRVTARIHGATLGGGIEMAAFACRVEAHPDTRIGLPEVQLGLVPGAGGTVSLPRRIGRQRTAALALAADFITVDTAMDWGLVESVAP